MRAILLLLAFTSPLLQTADAYQIGDTLYTWAPSGLNVRAEASASSSKVGKLQPGDRVVVLAKTDIPYSLTAIKSPKVYEDEHLEDRGQKPYQLNGSWVKVAGPGFTGYVIDMYLLAWKPPTPNTSFQAYFEKQQGESITMDTIWQRDASGIRNLDLYTYHGESSEGIVFEGFSGEGAIDESIGIPGMSLEEGFVFYNYFSALEDGLRRKNGEVALALVRHNDEMIALTEEELCYISISVREGILWIGTGCSC